MDPIDEQKGLNLKQPISGRRTVSNFISTAAYAPFQVTVAISSKALRLLRSLSPRLIPIVVYLLFVPLLILLSLSAGWVVWRSVAVGWETDVYFQYGDGVPPYAEVSLPNLVARQRYDISLHLVVPATDSNYAIGNFMTSLTLSTPSNQTLISIRRPTLALPPRRFSFLLPKLSTIELDIPLLHSYVVETTRLLARVELGRRDSWRSIGRGEGREISVLSGSLRGVIVHHGIRGLVTRFPIFFALISAATFLTISLLVLAACVLPIMRSRTKPATATDAPSAAKEEESRAPPLTADTTSEEEPKPVKRRKPRTGATRGSSDRDNVKTEAPSTILPLGDAPSAAPLRRRRSRLADPMSDSDS